MAGSRVVGRFKKAPFYWGVWYFLNRFLAKFLVKILRFMGFNERIIYAIFKSFNFRYDDKEKCFMGFLSGVEFKMVMNDRRAIFVPRVGKAKFIVKDIHYTFPTIESPRVHRTIEFGSEDFVEKLRVRLGEDRFVEIFGLRAKHGGLLFVKVLPVMVTPRWLVWDLDNLIRLLAIF